MKHNTFWYWSYVLKLSFDIGWEWMHETKNLLSTWDVTLACHTHEISHSHVTLIKHNAVGHTRKHTHVTHRSTTLHAYDPLCTAEIVVLATVQSDLSVLLDVDKLGRAWRRLGCFTFRKVEKRLRRLREGWQKNEKWKMTKKGLGGWWAEKMKKKMGYYIISECHHCAD